MAEMTTEAASSGSNSGSRREREFRRYAESVLGIHAAGSGRAVASSTDVSLTAFAQLVALRLNAKRVLISLIDKTSQYILAEATPTLSLQRDADHGEGDAMFFGTTILPRTNDWTEETIKSARKLRTKLESAGEDAALCIPDLASDPKYQNHQHVKAQPFIKSYVGVPLITPSGYAIGTLAVLDDQTRVQGVTRAEMRFLRDVATSVMAHLDLARVRIVHQRGLRMVRGLSRFIEGKDTIFDTSGTNQPSIVASGGRQASGRTNALGAGSNAERIFGAPGVYDGYAIPQSLQPRRGSWNPAPLVAGSVKDTSRPLQTSNELGESSRERRIRQPSAIELQEDAIAGDVGQTFQRAAKLIQQAMDMAGVLFVDASAGQFGSLRSAQQEGASSGGSSIGGSNMDATSGTETTRSHDTERTAHLSQHKTCRHLGAAYHVDEGGRTDTPHLEISEKFLRSLHRRYPYGKIFNYDDDGNIYSSERSDASDSDVSNPPKSARGKSEDTAMKRKRSTQSDAAKLHTLFPGIRSFAIMPVYDPQRSRYIAGALAWSYEPTRLFTFQDDLNYLGAFCDVLMAEAGRLEFQAEARSKTNFISSISHELRTPLHGILGAAEILQSDADDTDVQSRSQMVQVVDTCGRSLLDIIDNLLDHANPSVLRQKRKSARSRQSRESATSSEPVHDLAVLAEEVLELALWQTPMPAARKKSKDQPTLTLANDQTLKVIFDVNHSNLLSSGWNFHINAGAFRRILQNVATNAIKYTDNGGYFKLAIRMVRSPQRGRNAVVEIDCTDSGRGMSQAFLNRGLWEAFHQEDSYATGTGLGLSLVRTLVEEMNGTIDVKSTKDVGTSVVIRLPLIPGTTPDSGLLDSNDAASVQGLTFALVGFDASDDQSARSSEATNMLRHSVEHMCQHLKLLPFHADEISKSHPDVFIVTERRAIAAAKSDVDPWEDFQSGPCIILCDSVSSSRATSSLVLKAMSQSQASVMSQPIGPRQLLRALTSCLSKSPIAHWPQAAELSSLATPAAPPTAVSISVTATDFDMLDVVRSEGQASIAPYLHSTRPPMSSTESSVLLVDDNAVNLTILQKYMIRLGRQRISATNGLEAFECYQASQTQSKISGDSNHLGSAGLGPGQVSTTTLPASIIFMDITMPVMNGLESTRRIRAYERSHGIKPAMIVALTALASPQARQEAYSSGVDLFLTKPVKFAEIQQMFKDWEAEMVSQQ